ncbi:MAG: GntR family transcriptional regulator [Actinomycetota bacterium]
MTVSTGATELDRAAPLPLYFQLREAIVGEIHRRGLGPGDRLPTEAELERRYEVSRSTIRQAMNDLAADGVIRRIQGKGTFVGVPKIQHVPVLTSFSELLRSQGYTPSHRLLASSVTPAPPEVAEGLGLEEGAPCRFLRRLFLADGDPVGLAETWLPQALLGERDDLFETGGIEEGSLYELLQGEPLRLSLARAVETINPGLAAEPDAGLLGYEPGSPLLVIHRIAFTPDDRAVEWTRLLFAGDRYEYRVEMRRPAQIVRR